MAATTPETTGHAMDGQRVPRTDLPRPTRSAGAVATTLGVARRTVLRNIRTPQVFVIGLVQGAMFLLIFRYVFGGAITSGIRYVDFLVPGFVGTGVLFSGMGSATGVARISPRASSTASGPYLCPGWPWSRAGWWPTPPWPRSVWS